MCFVERDFITAVYAYFGIIEHTQSFSASTALLAELEPHFGLGQEASKSLATREKIQAINEIMELRWKEVVNTYAKARTELLK